MKVSGKGRQATSLHKPIQLLYPLEVPHPTPEELGDELETEGQDISSSSGSVPEDEPDVPPTNGVPTAAWPSSIEMCCSIGGPGSVDSPGT